MRPATLASRGETISSIMPCDTDTARIAAISAALITPGVDMRQEPGLAQHQRGGMAAR